MANMTFRIRFEGIAGIVQVGQPPPPPHAPLFLKSYDPEAFDGRGDSEWTKNKEEALVFDSFLEAVDFYRQIPKKRPLRDDLQPNRPLTTFDISVEASGDVVVSKPEPFVSMKIVI